MHSPPLPPLSTSNLLDAILAQFFDNQICCLGNLLGRDVDILSSNPSGVGYATSCKGLEVLDRMLRCIDQELSD